MNRTAIAITCLLAGCALDAADPATEDVAVMTQPASTSASITTDAASYPTLSAVTVRWTGLPGNSTDWVSIAPAGSAATTYVQWAYTGGAAAGQKVFGNVAAGSYVARAYVNNSYTIVAQSAAFVVSGAPLCSKLTMSRPSTGTYKYTCQCPANFLISTVYGTGIYAAGSPASDICTAAVHAGVLPMGIDTVQHRLVNAGGTVEVESLPDLYQLYGSISNRLGSETRKSYYGSWGFRFTAPAAVAYLDHEILPPSCDGPNGSPSSFAVGTSHACYVSSFRDCPYKDPTMAPKIVYGTNPFRADGGLNSDARWLGIGERFRYAGGAYSACSADPTTAWYRIPDAFYGAGVVSFTQMPSPVASFAGGDLWNGYTSLASSGYQTNGSNSPWGVICIGDAARDPSSGAWIPGTPCALGRQGSTQTY